MCRCATRLGQPLGTLVGHTGLGDGQQPSARRAPAASAGREGDFDGSVWAGERRDLRPVGELLTRRICAVMDVVDSPTGSRLATAGYDNRVRLADASKATRRRTHRLRPHRRRRRSLPSARWNMVGQRERRRQVRVWDLDANENDRLLTWWSGHGFSPTVGGLVAVSVQHGAVVELFHRPVDVPATGDTDASRCGRGSRDGYSVGQCWRPGTRCGCGRRQGRVAGAVELVHRSACNLGGSSKPERTPASRLVGPNCRGAVVGRREPGELIGAPLTGHSAEQRRCRFQLQRTPDCSAGGQTDAPVVECRYR